MHPTRVRCILGGRGGLGVGMVLLWWWVKMVVVITCAWCEMTLEGIAGGFGGCSRQLNPPCNNQYRTRTHTVGRRYYCINRCPGGPYIPRILGTSSPAALVSPSPMFTRYRVCCHHSTQSTYAHCTCGDSRHPQLASIASHREPFVEHAIHSIRCQRKS